MVCDNIIQIKSINVGLKYCAGWAIRYHIWFIHVWRKRQCWVWDTENCDTEGSVLCLVEELPKYQYHQPCFDNCFSTLPLLLILKGIGAGQVAASFKVNWIASSPLMADKERRAKRWGSHDSQTDNTLHKKPYIILFFRRKIKVDLSQKKIHRNMIFSANVLEIWSFQKQFHWNMILLVLSGKMEFLFPENMILFFRPEN